MATMTDEQRRLQLLNSYGPTGKVTAKYGNEAGATFNVNPGNTAGLRAGAIVQDGAGKQWIVGDDYKWAPYTGADQWKTVSAADDARQKLVQDWYDAGMDPANVDAASMETWLKEQGRLGAVKKPDYVLNAATINTLRSGMGKDPLPQDVLDTTRPGGMSVAEWQQTHPQEMAQASQAAIQMAAGNQSASSTQRGAESSGGAAAAAEPAAGATVKAEPTSAATGGTTGGVTEPWTGTMPTTEPFSYGPAPTFDDSQYYNRRDQLLDQLEGMQFNYDPNTDPVWQAYQKQYRREGQRATEDVLGRAAGMTGGVPSSYAVTAAAQAGNNYAAQLSDRLPQLYNDAYNRYLKEYERQLGLADTYNSLGQQDYNRYRDTLGQYNTDRNFAYGVYSDDYNRARQQYLDRYQEYLDEQNRRTGERNWAYGVEQDALDRALEADQTAYERGRDAIGDWRYDQQYIDSLREYDDQQLQQQISNAYKFISTFGYVPDWAAEVLGVPAGTSADSLGLGGGATGGGAGSTGGTGGGTQGGVPTDYAYAPDGTTYTIGSGPAWQFILNAQPGETMTGGDGSTWTMSNDGNAVTITKGGKTYTYSFGQSFGQSETPAAPAAQNTNPAPAPAADPAPAPSPAPTPAANPVPTPAATVEEEGGGSGSGVTSLDYDEDEGIFRWNGESYGSLSKLANAIDAANLTDSQKRALAKKFKTYGFNVSFD